jgi:hypothetical protein
MRIKSHTKANSTKEAPGKKIYEFTSELDICRIAI